MTEKWRLEGSVLDACNCTTLCPCVYAQPSVGPDCRVAFAWRIDKGHYGATSLDGLHAAAIMFAAGDPLLVGVERAAIILDERASPKQRGALLKIISGEAGGLWAVVAKLMKTPPQILFASFDYANDEKTWHVKAGSVLDVKAGYLKAAPGMPYESAPKRAQTYDPFFLPTGEKTVGISDHVKARSDTVEFEFSQRYSSAGRFVYAGP